MHVYKNSVQNHLNFLQENNFIRNYPLVSSSKDFPFAYNHKTEKEVVIWGNNNYLGMAQNSQVIEAKIIATKKYGIGSGGTRNVLGTSDVLNDLEQKIANWHSKEKAIIHNSALDANIGVLGALPKIFEGLIYISDEFNHASMIDGIKASGAEKHIFKHNDLDSLEAILKNVSGKDSHSPICVVVESIYSMTGDKAPLSGILKLKEKYNFLIYLDEVHAVGIYGKNGCGLADELKIADQIELICGTFGKAFGCVGGYITGHKDLCEVLRHYSRNFIFTTALQPDNAAAILKVLEFFESEEGKNLRLKHKEAVNKTKEQLKANNINYLDNNTHIIPIILGDERKTSLVAKNLIEKHNIAVTPLFYPTVPKGKARLRVNPTPFHNEEMIENFVTALKYEIVNLT